jgi:peptide/nickel transport system permease protein
MITYITRRLLWVVVTLWGVSVLTFLVAYAVPADPARLYAGPRASAEAVESIRHQMGLDRPVPVQYVAYIGQLLHGNFGYSYHLQSDVLPIILGHFPATAELAVAAILVELLLGLPLGILAALHRDTWIDRLSLMVSLLSVSLPAFALGMLLLYAFGFVWPIFPLGGYGEAASLVLPAATLGFVGAGWYARTLRTSMLDVLHQDYVLTARAKGLPAWQVTRRHVLRNAIGPIVTGLGLDMAYFLGGVLVIETVFSWPGVGLLSYNAIAYQDVPMIMGTVLFSALIILMMNLLIDISYGFLDPLVRFD